MASTTRKAPNAGEETEAPSSPPAGGTSGQSAKPVKGDVAGSLLHRFEQNFEAILINVERAILAKAHSYIDHDDKLQQQRADRAELLSAVATIFTQDNVPYRSEDAGFHAETDLATAYASKFHDIGLYMLPTVVETIPADQAGNVVVVVEFALAASSGAYWPAAVRVSGMGNDRVATNRGGTGDKAMSRALSAAWKEAITRLAFLAGVHDPEKHDLAHQPLGGTRPSNQGGQQRGNALSVKEEDEFRNRLIDTIRRCHTLDEIDELLDRDDVKAKWSIVSSRSRKMLTDEKREQEGRIRAQRERRGGGEDNRRGGDEGGDEGRRGGDDGGGYGGNDDIPF